MDITARYVITYVGNFKSTIESIHPLLKPVDESHVSNLVMPNGTIPLGYQTIFAVGLRDVLSFAHTRRERRLQFAIGLVVEGAADARIDKASEARIEPVSISTVRTDSARSATPR